jgi:hypothetical protein
MFVLIFAVIAAGPGPGANAALATCRPVLARKAEGQISTIDVRSAHRRGRTTTISGEIVVFVGMGTPAPGSASAHHLIRASYAYRCSVRGGKVVKTTLSQ